MTDRLTITIPNVLHNGSFPLLSNKLSNYQDSPFIRYGSVIANLPFHCFVDDWRLESIWRSPSKFVEKALLAGSAVAPDFSVYANYPHIYSLYQVWRSRIIAAWWHDHGVFAIPVLQWTNSHDSHLNDYFYGLQNCDVIAVRCPSREPDVIDDYLACAYRFLQIHQPKLVLHFGLKRGSELWPNCKVLPLNPKLVKADKTAVSQN
jgi:hypothetical protein